jgi:urease subunit gamma/beta
MRLTPQERDRLLIATAAMVARGRRERGLQLNVPETIALVSGIVIEAARDGLRLHEAVERARAALRPDEVLPGVADVVTEVRVEAVFDDGTRLVIVPDPVFGGHDPQGGPGAVLAAEPDPAARADPGPGATRVEIDVTNTASVPVSVTSHWHFFEANPRLRFDRTAAYGMRLDVPAGAAVRFEPGVRTAVGLVPIGGSRVAVGFAGLVDGPLDDPAVRAAALRRVAEFGYLTTTRSPGDRS